MQSPLQRIAQHVKHARHCARLARAARANGNPLTAQTLAAGARESINVARAIRASIWS